MKNQTSTQIASNEQKITINDTTTNLNARPQPRQLSQCAQAAVITHGANLIEILWRFSAADYMAQLQAMGFDYKNLLHAIDAGGGIERDPEENPAEVLAELRSNYTPTPRDMAERANLLRCMGDLLREVEYLVNGIKKELKEL